MATVDEVAKEVGGTEDVLGLLKSRGVESHVDRGLRVRPDGSS